MSRPAKHDRSQRPLRQGHSEVNRGSGAQPPGRTHRWASDHGIRRGKQARTISIPLQSWSSMPASKGIGLKHTGETPGPPAVVPALRPQGNNDVLLGVDGSSRRSVRAPFDPPQLPLAITASTPGRPPNFLAYRTRLDTLHNVAVWLLTHAMSTNVSGMGAHGCLPERKPYPR
jgi:hypothetical protein